MRRNPAIGYCHICGGLSKHRADCPYARHHEEAGRADLLRCRYNDCPEGHPVAQDVEDGAATDERITCPTCRRALGLPAPNPYFVRIPADDLRYGPYSRSSAMQFARIGSAHGTPREVWYYGGGGRRKKVRRYAKGKATYRGDEWGLVAGKRRRNSAPRAECEFCGDPPVGFCDSCSRFVCAYHVSPMSTDDMVVCVGCAPRGQLNPWGHR